MRSSARKREGTNVGGERERERGEVKRRVVDSRALEERREGGRESVRERRRKGNRGAFHVTTIINGYIPASSHGAIFGGYGGEREKNDRRGPFE